MTLQKDIYPILALDISTSTAHACLFTSADHFNYAQSHNNNQHSQTVLPLLTQLLKTADITWSDLHMLALGEGPGSFTGLRIASATMAGVNASLKLPIWELPSLGITAMQVESHDKIWVIEDARAGEVFCGCYQHAQPILADSCISRDELSQLSSTIQYYVSSDHFNINNPLWKHLPLTYERGLGMVKYIQTNISQLNDEHRPSHWTHPTYLQLSQAERQFQQHA